MQLVNYNAKRLRCLFKRSKLKLKKNSANRSIKYLPAFDEQPFAAASIGQVHKATLPSGEQVVVKVQYPGVEEACESDLKQVRLALRLMGVLKIDRKLQDQLFKEIQDSLDNELNYQIEAQNLEVASTFHQALDPKIIIPQVYKDYSSRHILTLSLEHGESISKLPVHGHKTHAMNWGVVYFVPLAVRFSS